MPVSRVQKTMASPLLIQFFDQNLLYLAVLDILYRGELGLAPCNGLSTDFSKNRSKIKSE
jgi:hypothetical protein